LTGPRHILVIANETVGGQALLDVLRERAAASPIQVTVICPQNDARAGFVVYEKSRRSSAKRRLRKTLESLAEAGIEARGEIVDPDPLNALRDALHEHRPDEIIISTHPRRLGSRWLRANVVERARKVAAGIPVTHVAADLTAPRDRAHVLVVANQTIVDQGLLAAIRKRADAGPVEFTLVAPADEPGVEGRLAAALAQLEAAGLIATGHLGDPDPYVAVMNALHEEHVDEVIISTFPLTSSGWLRRDLVGRVRSDGKRPVTHVVAERSPRAMVEGT
jgi:GABA permease